MVLDTLWDWLQAAVFPLPSQDGERPLFNFYHDEDPGLDSPGAAATRRANLRLWLERYTTAPRWLAIGEAPGWRGARFSGAPFVSEALLTGGALGVCGQATSRMARPYAEATATLFWQALEGRADLAGSILAWNCLPLHPHRPGEPLSNRRPAQAEIRAYLPLLVDLIGHMRPQTVIAVGRCAETALALAGVPALAVRHPSHGGAGAFQRQLRQALGISLDRL
jgi:uracil-DNA glycosylase